MKLSNKIFPCLLFFTILFLLLSFDLPIGWNITQSTNVKSYQMGLDKGAGLDGKNAATIKSIKKKPKGFGAMVQNSLADKYLGKRIRMTGLLKTKDVSNWAGLWLRVDDKKSYNFLSFDNMKDGKTDRSIHGTTEWSKYEIVLDVPIDASILAYGALLVGKGQIWFDDFKFEVVENFVPTTGNEKDVVMPLKEPVNLNFEN